MENNFLNVPTGHSDETTAKFEKKKLYVRNYSNEETVVYKTHKNKGHNPIKEDALLTRFCGGIMGDHDTPYIVMETEIMSVTFILVDI